MRIMLFSKEKKKKETMESTEKGNFYVDEMLHWNTGRNQFYRLFHVAPIDVIETQFNVFS